MISEYASSTSDLSLLVSLTAVLPALITRALLRFDLLYPCDGLRSHSQSASFVHSKEHQATKQL